MPFRLDPSRRILIGWQPRGGRSYLEMELYHLCPQDNVATLSRHIHPSRPIFTLHVNVLSLLLDALFVVALSSFAFCPLHCEKEKESGFKASREQLQHTPQVKSLSLRVSVYGAIQRQSERPGYIIILQLEVSSRRDVQVKFSSRDCYIFRKLFAW